MVKNRDIINIKKDVAPPIVASSSFVLMTVIDAKEACGATTMDIKVSYLHADINEMVHMLFEAELAEILVRKTPEVYQKYVTISEKSHTFCMLGYQRHYTDVSKAHCYFANT